jgi:hypothetical protein
MFFTFIYLFNIAVVCVYLCNIEVDYFLVEFKLTIKLI